MSNQLLEFSDKLAAIMPEIGSDRLPSLLLSMLNGLVPFDNALIIHYFQGEAPKVHFNDIPPLERKTQIELFVNSAFLLDPFYRAAVDNKQYGLHRLSDLAPEGFEKTEYYRSYFKHTEIKDEVGYIIPLSSDQFLNVSLSRLSFAQRFNRTQIAILSDITAVVEAICKAQWGNEVRSSNTAPDNQLPGQLDSALKHFGTAYLTDRESQVVQLFLHGHSTKSIAERLGISPETVKLHRKNSYAKLDVSSQAELFYLFIDSLASLTSYSGGDPLVGYL
ncbi:LuxR C-terminal-related transcriptional regulator [bacterium]|nr:LuxR C-terminal-related transcriptional regulator [bacterium]MDG1166020.1 LuxR C-terminal-related transcriptional regulator [Porticoccaceae bacterium]MDG1311248.1 LuxR C-terminal-related transcriptional regulator [Porticoccaceae bacterium]